MRDLVQVLSTSVQGAPESFRRADSTVTDLRATARLLAYVAREGGPLSRHLASLPHTFATPELRA